MIKIVKLEHADGHTVRLTFSDGMIDISDVAVETLINDMFARVGMAVE